MSKSTKTGLHELRKIELKFMQGQAAVEYPTAPRHYANDDVDGTADKDDSVGDINDDNHHTIAWLLRIYSYDSRDEDVAHGNYYTCDHDHDKNDSSEQCGDDYDGDDHQDAIEAFDSYES